MRTTELPQEVLGRRVIVYVRQSTMAQVAENLESQRRQYDLVELAKFYGFRDVAVIDEDLGRSARGAVARPGFESLVAHLWARESSELCSASRRLGSHATVATGTTYSSSAASWGRE